MPHRTLHDTKERSLLLFTIFLILSITSLQWLAPTAAATTVDPPDDVDPNGAQWFVLYSVRDAVELVNGELPATPFLIDNPPGPWPADYPGVLHCGHPAYGDAGCTLGDVPLETVVPIPLSACSWSPTNHPCFIGWITASASWAHGGLSMTCWGPAFGMHTMLCETETWGMPPEGETALRLDCTGWGYGDFGCAWFA